MFPCEIRVSGAFPRIACVSLLGSAMLDTMTTAPNTPGFNCRITVFFTYDKNGNKRARYIGKHNPFRSFPLPLAHAELFIAQDQAERA